MNQNVLYGRQLMFDEVSNNIVEEGLNYWKTMDDVPKHIKDFILNLVSTRAIYDINTKQYYCSKCLKTLDNLFYCSNCSIQYKTPILNNSKYVINSNIKNINEYEDYTLYFVFDIVDGQVLLYTFCVYTYYYNNMKWKPYQINKIYIKEVYHITTDGLISLLNNDFISFKEYDKEIDEGYDFDLLDIFEFSEYNNYLYTDNLFKLKNTSLYRYTSIWELKDYFENHNFVLSSLTYYPVHLKQFEYLVKMKLFNLAITGSKAIVYKQNFRDTFGVDKKYYPFMKDNDIDISQLLALRICPTTDIDLVNFISKEIFIFQELSKYVSASRVKEYLENQNLDYHNISEYYDYIKCCECLGLNMKDKKVLYPSDFIKEHDKITKEKIMATDSKINEKIISLSNILSLNFYEDEKYIIFPASSVDSLIDESSQMSNCVRNYCIEVSNNECQIYFMRYKDSVNKSLVTIEVKDGQIVQAKMRFNEFLTDEIDEVLKKWERDLLLVTNK